MAKNSTTVLRKGSRVVATIDLRGVPSGTLGTIRMVAGLTWTRYRVDFANGVSLGSVDGAQIAAQR